MKLERIIKNTKKHANKITASALILGTLASNPDHYFSECMAGVRDATELPYTQLKMHQYTDEMPTGSPKWMREHEKVSQRVLADGLEDGDISYLEAIRHLGRKYLE